MADRAAPSGQVADSRPEPAGPGRLRPSRVHVWVDVETRYHMAMVCGACGAIGNGESINREMTHTWRQQAQAHAQRTMHVVSLSITQHTTVAPHRRFDPRPAA